MQDRITLPFYKFSCTCILRTHYIKILILIGIKSAPLIKSNDEIPKEVIGSRAAPISNWIALRWAINRPASRSLSDIANLESRKEHAVRDASSNSVSIAIPKPACHIVKWFPGNIGFLALMRTCSLETALLRRTMAVGIGVGDKRRIQSRSDLIRFGREIKLGSV